VTLKPEATNQEVARLSHAGRIISKAFRWQLLVSACSITYGEAACEGGDPSGRLRAIPRSPPAAVSSPAGGPEVGGADGACRGLIRASASRTGRMPWPCHGTRQACWPRDCEPRRTLPCCSGCSRCGRQWPRRPLCRGICCVDRESVNVGVEDRVEGVELSEMRVDDVDEGDRRVMSDILYKRIE
jgi:hypothetical protein